MTDPADALRADARDREPIALAWRLGFFDRAAASRRAAPLAALAVARGDRAGTALGLAYDLLFLALERTTLEPAREALDAHAAGIDAGGDARARALLDDALAILAARSLRGDLDAVAAPAHRRLALGDALRPPGEALWSRVALVYVELERRRYDDALRHAAAIRPLAARGGDPVFALIAEFYVALVLMHVADFEGAEPVLRRALGLADALGRAVPKVTVNLLLTCVMRGDLAAAEALVPRLPDPPALWARPTQALLAIVAGRLDAAEALLDPALPHDRLPHPFDIAWVRARALVDLRRGRASQARDGLLAYFARAARDGRRLAPFNDASLHQVLGEVEAALGDPDAAARAFAASRAACFRWSDDGARVRDAAVGGTAVAPDATPAASEVPVAGAARSGGSAGDGDDDRCAATSAGVAAGARASPHEADPTPGSVQFLAKVSHEMRTPLHGMLGMTSLLMLSELDEQQRRYVHLTQTSAKHLLTLCNDVVDLATIESGRFELRPQPFALRALVDELTAVFEPTALAAGLRLSADVDAATPPVVDGDPIRVRQVLFNLVGNALKFTGRGGVTVRVRPAGTRVRFEVVDTGSGIGADDRARVFLPYEQVRRADGSPAAAGGSGLGLALCRELVQLMRGMIGVDSELGHGSRFWFEVPLPAIDRLSETV